MTRGVGIKLGLLDTAVMDSVWISVADPEEMPVKATDCAVAFWLMIRLLMAFNVGG